MTHNSLLTKAMKDTITQLRLIDTGALLRSAEVWVKEENGMLTLNVLSKDYIKYHVYSRHISEIFMRQPGVNDEIGRLLIPVIQKAIQRVIDGGEVYFKPEVYLKYNDRQLS